MNRQRILKHLIFLMFFVFIADLLAKKFYWYYSIWYFDMFMHFLGGLWVGMFFLYIFNKKEPLSKQFLATILGVIVIGILWEFFEFFTFNNIGHDKFNPLDTVSDLLFDLAGGVFAIFYFMKRIMRISGNIVQ